MHLTVEAWTPRGLELDARSVQLISNSGLADLELLSPPDLWRVVPASKVGVIEHGPDWSFRVVPRLAIPRLMFLLAYAADPRGWRDSLAHFSEETEFFASIASGFAHHAYNALEPAPLRGYVSVDERAMTLRGRLRVQDQLARTVPLPLEVTYDDYTVDVAENRILLSASELLLRTPLVPDRARKRLLRIRAALDGVQSVSPPITVPPITRLNRRYEPALRLAELILSGSSITTQRGGRSSVAFTFDMNKVFEDFLFAALRSALAAYGGSVQAQYAKRRLDRQRRIRLKPDITWWKSGVPGAVVDAKYKRLVDARFPNADAYQMLAYCTAFDLERGYLVYARDDVERDRSHLIAEAEITIEVRALDVEREPQELLPEVDLLAAELAGSEDPGLAPDVEVTAA